MWRNDFRHRRPDAANPLEGLQRAERTERVAVGDDPSGERWSYPWQTLQLGGGRAIEVDERSRPLRRSLSPGTVGATPTAAVRLPRAPRISGYAPRGIDGSYLLAELLAGGDIELGRIAHGACGPDGSPEEEQTSQEGERSALGRSCHGRSENGS
jgi:hypothetical protein